MSGQHCDLSVSDRDFTRDILDLCDIYDRHAINLNLFTLLQSTTTCDFMLCKPTHVAIHLVTFFIMNWCYNSHMLAF